MRRPAREVLTGVGPVTVRVPKTRDRAGQGRCFRSALLPPYLKKTRRLEAVIPWLYLKGVSTNDFDEALQALFGWKGLTTRGALVGGGTGLVLSVVPMILSQRVWVDVFGNERALFPFDYPTAFSLAAEVIATVLVSRFDRSKRAAQDRGAFAAQTIRSMEG